MSQDEQSVSSRWAYFRLSVIGQLLASPPAHGELSKALAALSQRSWRHPITGEAVKFGYSTLERWYYQARAAGDDPVAALVKRVRKDANQQPSISPLLAETLREQWRAHSRWSYQLHVNNLEALVKKNPALGPVPSYWTVRRYMKRHGLHRRPRKSREGEEETRADRQAREVRSFEVEYVHGLWHLDFHKCSRKLLKSDGSWSKPYLLAILDDHSRLICHAQWYWEEDTESLVHGLSQALQKRGLPRALMSDNGSAMIAGETRAGLQRLGILHETTQVRSPYQNGKQENFFCQIEGRLLPMLEGKRDVTIELLNHATQAWTEQEYHLAFHSEIAMTPLERYRQGPDVGRECPDSDGLRRAFRIRVKRRVRRSDGTVSLDGQRFEVPARYCHLREISMRYARWDLSAVDLIDSRTDAVLCRLYPLDRAANADARRKPLAISEPTMVAPDEPPESGLAPLLEELMDEYDATGLRPAYLPKGARIGTEQDNDNE